MSRLVSRVAASRRQEQERGAAAIQYVGIVIATAFLVTALIATVPSAREWIVCTAKQVNAPIVGGSSQGGCDVGGGVAGPRGKNDEGKPPKPPCVVSGLENVTKRSANILWLDLGYDTTARNEVLSDGTVKVTMIDKGKLGVGKGIGKGGGDSAVQGRAGIGVEGVIGREYTFKSQEEADEFARYVATGGPYQRPDPSATYADLSAVVSATGQVGAIVGGGAAGGLGGGAKKDSDGNTTYYSKVLGSLNGKVVDGAVQGSLEVESILAVTVGPDGKMTQVEVTETYSGEGAVALTRELPGGVGVGGGVGKGVIVADTMTFPVTDANREATAAALKAVYGLNILSPPKDGSPSWSEAWTWMKDQANSNGDVWRQQYDVTKGVLEAGYTNLIAFGWGSEISVSGKTSLGVWDWDPAIGWVLREGCH